MNVLIADDEPVIRAGVRMLLQKCFDGVVIIGEAKNGKEALELIEAKRPDVLITDIRMPVMDGLQLIETVKKRQLDMNTIILSGYSDFEYARLALRFGVSDFLIKPVTQEKMNEAIMRIIHQNPNRWIGKLSPDILLEMKRTVDKLVRHMTAEDRESILCTVADWRTACAGWGMSLGLQKHLLGYLKLAYETELLAIWPSMQVLGAASDKAELGEHELYILWTEELMAKADWISTRRSPRNRRVFEQVMEHIERNYGNPELSINHLAEICGVSAAYLSKMFRETANRPLTQVLAEFRLKRVKEWLERKDDSKISEIAESCGFNDYPYFSRLFKKIYGVSPQEYRDRHQ